MGSYAAQTKTPKHFFPARYRVTRATGSNPAMEMGVPPLPYSMLVWDFQYDSYLSVSSAVSGYWTIVGDLVVPGWRS